MGEQICLLAARRSLSVHPADASRQHVRDLDKKERRSLHKPQTLPVGKRGRGAIAALMVDVSLLIDVLFERST
ncbi:MAG TPA: hypothetical protein V6D34_04385 [Candidatus Sericytochromatia bacterium]